MFSFLTKKDPFDLHFKVGVLAGVCGVGIWLLYIHQWIPFYPRPQHAFFMFYAFLWAFISGFLMTAVPRMTQTNTASKFEVALSLFCILLQCALLFTNELQISFFIYILQILILLKFVGYRMLKRKKLPFDGFIFVGFAFALNTLGVVFYLLDSQFKALSIFSMQAFVINLVLGVGSRLIPLLSRIPNSIEPTQEQAQQNRLELLAWAIALNSSFIAEYLFQRSEFLLLRFVVLSLFSIRHLKLLKKPSRWSSLSYGLKTSIVFTCIGYLLAYLNPANELAWLHLVFIGGLALVTLMVATRVSLAHTGQNLDLEFNNKPALVVIAGFLISSLLRVQSGIWMQSSNYYFLLSFSIFIFIGSVAFWSYRKS